ncbi:mycofactocin biosynthesis peptidyl-dipeptidase MftE [Nocardia canadensis]|uniref:mycofactocin biosynthesis peptidyl-dipeptidase MftE n=1 Tax=Nocardia canadensis TaxID=3065238 RepID=UPI00292F9942|nr:mycofactocin biosynthesis peptidyl-dipeptidase MftE [Nocardia canadensis]
MRRSRRLADLSWTDARDLALSGAMLAVPLGSTEQHGLHLPLSTDTDVAVALCNELAYTRSDLVVAPAVTYGSSGAHAGFAGTLSISQEAIELLVTELGRSACRTFDHVLFVSAHGGNADPVGRAISRLCAESLDARAFTPRWVGESHAGHTETALMLAIRPVSVRMHRAVTSSAEPVRAPRRELRCSSVAAVSETGILGDPVGATGLHGGLLMDCMVTELTMQVAQWRGERAA